MKIEDFAIEMHSQHTSSRTVTTIFELELSVQNEQRVRKLDITGKELEFAKQLEYMMVQEFIFSLQSITKQSIGYNLKAFDFKEIDIKEFNIKEIQSRQISLTQEIYQCEKLDIQMNGYIQTATQKIKIDIDISFSSTFVQKHQLIKTQFYDPLVLNFDGELPDLENKRFSFDIDCDGKKDQISLLKDGNGFLAFDKNKNGIIDDGTELFGTQNGNGFYDLRRYDDDNNGWIDENDSIFESLCIWSKTEKEDKLVALGEMGVGAIYLGSNEENFNLKTNENEILGRIRANGLFLNEDGSSGLVSQIDFAKKDDKNRLSELLKIA